MDTEPKNKDRIQKHRHFNELTIAGIVEDIMRSKEDFRFLIAVHHRIHPLDGNVQSNYFAIQPEDDALDYCQGNVYPGDYIVLRANIRAYLGFGAPFGNPKDAWFSPVQIYINKVDQILCHEICSNEDKQVFGLGIKIE